jgi:hypothetical protein
MDDRERNRPFANALNGVRDHTPFGIELCRIFDMLQLASTTAIARIMFAGRLHTHRRWFHHTPQRSTSKVPLSSDRSRNDIPRRRPWNEHDQSIGTPNSVSARRNGVDGQANRA